MHIKILGTGCSKCNNLEIQVRELVGKHRIEAEVTKISDINLISQYGIVMTPGIVIDERLVSVGYVPSSEEILKLIADAQE